MSFEKYIPQDLRDMYEVHDYLHAAAILANEYPKEFEDICNVLRQFVLTEKDIMIAGGNESRIPKKFSALLRPLDWEEKKLKAKLVVDDVEVNHDTHKVDYCKGRVAFDLEWNSKDQTFDRDLYAFRAFHEYGKISLAILVTRSEELNTVFTQLGPDIKKKYGASTTWMGKLIPRLKSGRNGGCPVLVFGITPRVIKPGDESENELEKQPIAKEGIEEEQYAKVGIDGEESAKEKFEEIKFEEARFEEE